MNELSVKIMAIRDVYKTHVHNSPVQLYKWAHLMFNKKKVSPLQQKEKWEPFCVINGPTYLTGLFVQIDNITIVDEKRYWTCKLVMYENRQKKPWLKASTSSSYLQKWLSLATGVTYLRYNCQTDCISASNAYRSSTSIFIDSIFLSS